MIENLSIRNFKVLREVELALRPLTVIVGPNASGKSSILQAVALFSGWLKEGRATKVLGERLRPDVLFSRNSDGPTVISCKFTVRNQADESSLNLSETDDSLYAARFRSIADRPIWNYTLLNLDIRKLAAPSSPTSTSLNLPSDGEGLPSILAGLRLEYPDRFENIVERLKTVINNLISIRVRRAKVGDVIGDELLFDLKGARAIPASAVSEGTLLTLGVLTALSTSESPYVALIDDLERGLHPKALGSLITQLRLLQKQDPELQIIATSHSPYLLDYLQADEVLLTSLDKEGYASVQPLTHHPEYERWKELMGPGEFWSTVGEDWVTQPKKATA